MKRLLLTLIISLVLIYPILAGTVEKNHFIYHASSDRYVNEIDSAISEARSRLIYLLQDSLNYRPDIYIEDNLQNFGERIGGIFPDWGAAAAMPFKQMIVIKSPAHFRVGKSLRELMMHEYSHLALDQRLFHGRAPRWMDEGLAMYVASEWGWSQNFAMSRAIVFNSLIPLSEIDRMNSFGEGQAQTAYAESSIAVKYFLDEYGVELFNLFLDNLRKRKSVDEALLASIGSDMEEYEKEFSEYMKGRYNYMSLFGDLYFLWIFLAAVVFGGYIYSFFKKKKYYRKWDEEEKYQSTDFDYGDPDNPEQIDDEDEPWR